MKKKPAQPEQSVQSMLDLREGQSLELLQALHILTREGKINQDSRRKLKQVYHLFHFIEELLQSLETVVKEGQGITLADHGAGKSYLGFIVYDLYFRQRSAGQVYGIACHKDTPPDLIKRLQAALDALIVDGGQDRIFTAYGLPPNTRTADNGAKK